MSEEVDEWMKDVSEWEKRGRGGREWERVGGGKGAPSIQALFQLPTLVLYCEYTNPCTQ